MSKLARRLWKWTAATLAAILILLAIGVGLFRLAVPLVPGLRADAEAMAERALGWPVHIGDIDLQWALFGPELVLTDVQLLAPDDRVPLVTAAQMDIIFGPLDLFQEGVPRPSHVRLHRPTLALERSPDGNLFLSGHSLPGAGQGRGDWRELLELGLRHGRLTVRDGQLHYRDPARGIEDWTLGLADVTLASDGRNHTLEGNVVPPDALGEKLVLEFSAKGAPGSPETWEWTLDFETEALRLQDWYRQLGWRTDGAVQGRLDIAGEANGKGLDAFTARGSLGIENLVFAEDTAPDGLPGHFDAVALLWKLERDGEKFQAGINSLVLEGAKHFEGGALSVKGSEAEDYPLEVRAFRLPLSAVAGLTRLLPPADEGVLSKTRDAVERLAPEGEIQSLVLGLDVRGERPRFHVEADFRDLGVRHWQELPGIAGLTGSLRGDEQSGELLLDSRGVSVDLGTLFRTPLPLERLTGTLSWQAAGEGWQILGRELAVSSPGVSATADLVLDLPADGGAQIDLEATARDVDLAVRSTWLPVGVMPDTLIHWLDTAIIGGHVPEAGLVLRGPLGKFPFRDGGGTFDIRFATRDAVVAYAPGWPRVEGLHANVHFDGPGLDIRVEQAKVGGIAVESGQARFADLRAGLLDVDAVTAGSMANAWAFLAASPLNEPLAGLLDALAVDGPMRARVALEIPLKHVADTRVKVDAVLDGITVHPVSLPWTVEGLQGEVTVTDSAVTASKLEGRLTGHPFSASVEADPAAASDKGFAASRIHMQGRMPVSEFEGIVPEAWLARVEGEFDWTGDLHVGGSAPFRVRLDSDLADVTSTLPAPLDAVRPVTVEITLPEPSRIAAGFDVQDLGTGRVLYAETGGDWTFERGRLSLGTEAWPELPDAPGLHVEGEVARFAAADWLAVGAATAGEGGEPLLGDFAIQAAQFEAGAMTLRNQAVSGTRLEGSGWQLQLAGPATGRVLIPPPDASGYPWQLLLERLHLPMDEVAAEGKGPSSAPDPRKLPGLIVDIGDLRVGPIRLGHVSGELRRTAIGYTTENLRATAPSFVLELDGRWEVIDDEHYTSINSVLESSDIGDTLAALGYAGGIDADDGRIETSLAWHASPIAMKYGLLEGTVSFSLEDGSLREVSPGAGRLIGLLSLSALPRRLFLDFSDFFGEGLSFDSLKGDFLLTEGNAYTTNVRLEGPSVSALLVGRTGLAARDYDQLAIVDPGVSASLPVAGYLAAGPSVGAALLLLSQLLEAPLSDMTQVKYRITGSWDEPVVQRVQESNASRKSQTNRP